MNIKEEYTSDDENDYKKPFRSLIFQHVLDEEEPVRKSLGRIPSRKLNQGAGGEAVAMATALGANNSAATATVPAQTNGATITVVAANQILQVAPTVVTVQTRDHSPDTISITAVPTAHQTGLSQVEVDPLAALAS